jgi:hypothetical protein
MPPYAPPSVTMVTKDAARSSAVHDRSLPNNPDLTNTADLRDLVLL